MLTARLRQLVVPLKTVTGARCPLVSQAVPHSLANAIAREAAQIGALDAGERGKPLSVAFASEKASVESMRFHAEGVDKFPGDTRCSDKNSLVLERCVPRGVVAAIMPWNFPTYCSVAKITPALAAGNCVVVNASEMSSRSAIRLTQLAADSGMPEGVLNVVPGLGEMAGSFLAMRHDGHGDIHWVHGSGKTNA